ncbi:sigma factor-like helix-turn-helix DNA-binding protein [Streptomyces sp. NPDC059460]|uniref:sigma factor-like helix-turn-helix DNA-binding protein n=1 Tax=Streptomyces sp. NPDC059460 TaxID=3346840 RepID=UPI0036B092BD
MTQSATDTAGSSPLPSPKERRRLREAQSLSEEQVAAAMGVTPATVRAWESGRASPQGRKREAYAKLIGSAGTGGTGAPGASESTPPGAHGKRADLTKPSSSPAQAAAPEGTSAGTAETAGADEPPTTDRPDAPVPALTPAEAFDALYVKNAAALFRQTFLLTGRRSLSREAVERAFEQAWQRWPEVAVDRDPAGWVRAAAYEYAVSPWHRLRRAHRHPDPPPAAPGARALLDALLDLPPSYRRTLLLYDGVGLDLPETAAETEASTPAAASRLMNARAAVAEQVPELAEPSSPTGQSALLHEQLGALALTQPVAAMPAARAIRDGSEHKARLWTRAALALTALIVGIALITTVTSPVRYGNPPVEQVGGASPRSGPQKLTPQDLKLQKKLREELVRGPARLVPELR